jgi:hypothetical protein
MALIESGRHGHDLEGAARIDHRACRNRRGRWIWRRPRGRYFGALRRFAAHHAERRELCGASATDDRAYAIGRRIWRLERPDEANKRMAHSSRYRASSSRYRRNCAFPVASRHRSGHGAQIHPSCPFDDRAIWRADRSVRQICARGTKEQAGLALEALDQGHAVLLSNHCAMTTGPTLEAALVRAQELETLARLYAIALSLGRPAILSDEEVGRISDAPEVERRRCPGAHRGPC